MVELLENSYKITQLKENLNLDEWSHDSFLVYLSAVFWSACNLSYFVIISLRSLHVYLSITNRLGKKEIRR